jgi:hypothetical protein
MKYAYPGDRRWDAMVTQLHRQRLRRKKRDRQLRLQAALVISIILIGFPIYWVVINRLFHTYLKAPL